jgi:hypothetical protein
MRTLEECKDEVAKSFGHQDWDSIHFNITGFFLNDIIRLYAKEVAQQALIDASENVELVETIKNSAVYDKIDKDLIINTPIKLL